MSAKELFAHTIEQLIPLIRDRKVSPTEVTQSCLHRIEALNGSLCAYATVLTEQALERAREAENVLSRGEARSALHGVPVSVKDVFETAGIPTTWGANDLAKYCPSEDSTIVIKLREAGAILLGKANVDMYPYYGEPESRRLIGPTRNPWNLERTAGRSSGGSAASVAAFLDYGSIGSDQSGSIRTPAALCGVVGLKPTFGLVSNYRVFPYSSSFDCSGPLTRSVYDCALLLGAIAGYDPKDPASVNGGLPDYTCRLGESVRGLKVGVSREAWEGNDTEVTRVVANAVEVLASLGMEIHNVVDVPSFRDARWLNVVSVLEITAMAQATVTTPRPADPYTAYLLGRDAAGRKRLVEQGMRISRVMEQRYAEIFRSIDLMVTPTVPITAPRMSENASPWQLPDEPFVEMLARYARNFNFIRYPAISIPCGFAADGMPVGLQIAGRPFEEETLLRAAHAYERATSWHTQYPAIS